MLKADELLQCQREIDGKCVVAKPIIQPLIKRVRDAVKVIKGEAEAVIFYKQ